jgi:hypothetical protein
VLSSTSPSILELNVLQGGREAGEPTSMMDDAGREAVDLGLLGDYP